MKESSTYQAILEEGRTEGAIAEAKKLLRQWGADAFGTPDAQTALAIERLNDLARLEDLLRRLHSASSWQELLGAFLGGPRRRRQRPSN